MPLPFKGPDQVLLQLMGIDTYLIEWRRHSLESAEREIIWLEKMIKTERKS